jgi:two-component system phosphate regulon sensor histidine kinase PhoR
MKKKAIVIIVVLTSISLLGIVLTQLYWVKNSMDLKEELFDNSVRIAIKSVSNQLMENKNDSVFQQYMYDLSCRKPKLDVTDVIIPKMLDSLLNGEFKSMSLDDNYFYAIYNRSNSKFISGNYDGNQQALLDSPFQFSVSSIYRPGDYYLSIYFPAKRSILLRQMEIWLLLTVFFLVVLIISFFYVISTILKQKKVSEMKTDFINNMTHEFKTPLATSHLAAEMILRSEIIKNPDRIKKYAKVILDENIRLQGQVEQVLQVATLENSQHRFKMKKINVHHILESVIESFELRIKENGIKMKVALDAKNPQVVADSAHVMNVFYNLMDNAIKYTPEKPKIEIKTWNTKGGIHVEIKDNGIGIDLQFQKNIFENLYRVPTGNIHEVRGFGLGLYYAKSVIDQHNGRINLESELDKGSSFDVYLPFNG